MMKQNDALSDPIDILWTIRKGFFCGNEYRIPVKLGDVGLVREYTNGVHSWNPEVGDYIRVNKTEKKVWDMVCKMHS